MRFFAHSCELIHQITDRKLVKEGKEMDLKIQHFDEIRIFIKMLYFFTRVKTTRQKSFLRQLSNVF